MKTALIVDDSPLARTVLRRTLSESSISVDEAQSAEVAIEYLRSERPDVIFLDHLMSGMDGFEALQAIKANPDTAMIPVIMYTSQDGQLYMSQARALGAVDVLPKTLKPADVRRLLRTHHLTENPEPIPSFQQAVRDVRQAAQGVVDTARTIHEEKILDLVRSELHEYRNTLLSELRAQLHRMDNDPVKNSPTEPPKLRPNGTATFGKQLAVATAATLFAAACWFGSFYIHAARLQSAGTQRLPKSALVPEIAGTQQDEASGPALPDEFTRTDAADRVARRQTGVHYYAFGAIPLDDDRARDYERLLGDLKNEGFAGTVQLDIFEGRFCLNLTSDGRYELAPPNQPAIACDRIGTPTETVSTTQQSVLFSNMIAVAGRDGQLRVEAVFHGPTLPIVNYPELSYGVTAGEWNSAAAYNQRVALRLAQDEFDTRSSRIAHLGNRNELDRIVADLVR